MSGQAGGRGYLLQTLFGLLESLDDKEWQSVQIDPTAESEKIDILWVYPNRRRAVQVKSSQNQFTWPEVRQWCADLEEDALADRYELVLVGTASQNVLDNKTAGKVAILPPVSNDNRALLERAAHRLDLFLRSIGIATLSPQVRELLAHAFATKLSDYSTNGKPVSRKDFERNLSDWVMALYPSSAESRSVSPAPTIAAARPTPDDDGFAKEVAEVEAVRLCSKIREKGYWQLIVRPARYQERRIPLAQDLPDILSDTQVEIRNYAFPYDAPPEETRRGNRYWGSDVDDDFDIEVQRLYQSGLFVAIVANRTEWHAFPNAPKEPAVHIDVATVQLATFFGFASKWSLSKAGDTAMVVDIAFRNLAGRVLFREGFPRRAKPASGPEFHFNRTFSPNELSDPRRLSIEVATDFFWCFSNAPGTAEIPQLFANLK